jgi:7-carboxy-7-deazaguanine synthase
MQVASISEIFESVMGEGVGVGRPAVFIRLGGCNLTCSYCDTGYARRPSDSANLYVGAESSELTNPVACDDVVRLVGTSFGPVPTAVITGGEPLVQAGAVGEIASGLRRAGYKIHLETNGTLAGEFDAIKRSVDFTSMDIKLPSSQEGRGLWGEHRAFLREMDGVAGAAKVVVTGDAGDDEVADAVHLVAEANPFLPFLLQPEFRGGKPAVGGERLMQLRALASRKLHDVRISVQIHKVMGLR